MNIPKDYNLLTAVEGAVASGARELEWLRHENHELRVSREALIQQLREGRDGWRLPDVHEVPHRSYVIPLIVGSPQLLARDAAGTVFDYPDDSPRHYRLTFVREYGERGDFWRVQPFATEPRGRR